MNSIEKRLKALNEKITSFEKVLNEKRALLEQLPEEFSLELSIHSLKAQLDDLMEQKLELLNLIGVEEIDLRLYGQAVESGSASIRTVGRILTGFQDVVDKLALGLKAGKKGRIKKSIQNLTRLKMTEVYSGSFGFRFVSGNDQQEMSEIKTIQKSMGSLFDILETVDNQKDISDLAEGISARTLMEFKGLLDTIDGNDLEFDLNWVSQDGNYKKWSGSKEKIRRLITALQDVETWETTTEVRDGYIITAAAEDSKFKFRAEDNDEIILGAFDEKLRNKVAEVYDKWLVHCTFEKTVIHSTTRPERIQWLMVKIEEF